MYRSMCLMHLESVPENSVMRLVLNYKPDGNRLSVRSRLSWNEVLWLTRKEVIVIMVNKFVSRNIMEYP